MPRPNPVVPYDEDHLTPNDPNMEFLHSRYNPFDDNVAPYWINDWRPFDWDDW